MPGGVDDLTVGVGLDEDKVVEAIGGGGGWGKGEVEAGAGKVDAETGEDGMTTLAVFFWFWIFSL